MGLIQLLTLAFAATATAQVASSSAVTSVATPPSVSFATGSSASQVFLPPSGTNLPPPPSSHVHSDSSASVSVITTTIVSNGAPWPSEGVTIQTSVQANSTLVTTMTVSSEVPASSGAEHSGHQTSTVVLTTTASGSASKATSATSSAPASQSSSAGLQNEAGQAGKVGGVGVALAMLMGVLGA